MIPPPSVSVPVASSVSASPTGLPTFSVLQPLGTPTYDFTDNISLAWNAPQVTNHLALFCNPGDGWGSVLNPSLTSGTSWATVQALGQAFYSNTWISSFPATCTPAVSGGVVAGGGYFVVTSAVGATTTALSTTGYLASVPASTVTRYSPSTSSSSPAPVQNEDLGGGAIAGIAIGAFAALTIAAITAFVLIRRSRKRLQRPSLDVPDVAGNTKDASSPAAPHKAEIAGPGLVEMQSDQYSNGSYYQANGPNEIGSSQYNDAQELPTHSPRR